MPRVIYSLIFDFRTLSGATRQLVAPLDAAGQSPHCLPVPPKQRVIDLRVGDFVRHGRNVDEIAAVRAYREADWPDGATRLAEGYEVRRAG